jgi:hypothetical protein
MPIPLPNLDDRSYAELTAQAQALLPSLYPDWTNYNPSDPGITMVELFAWLTEMLLFQVNQVTPDSVDNFLKLLNGPGWTRPDTVTQHDAITSTMLGLREIYRAVTPGDYEWLALNAWPGTDAAGKLPGGGKIARVRCVPRRDLTATDPAARSAEAQAHVSLVVLPGPELAGSEDALYQAMWQFFDDRRLLTVRHHVVGPGYLPVQISANLALRDDVVPQDALSAAHQALAAYYDPLAGGPQRAGWPFGRAVYQSEASALLVDQVPALAYVENVQVTSPGNADRVQTGDSGQPVAVLLDAGELVQLGTTALVAYDSLGHSYQQT